MVDSHKGQSPYNTGTKGIHCIGVDHASWKGIKVSYRALHKWVEYWLGKPDMCEHCGTSGLKGKQIDWANKSRKYKRVLTDWIRLCKPCHKAYDTIQS